MSGAALGAEQREKLRRALVPRMTPFIPNIPTLRQRVTLCMNGHEEILYGGAAGGGKTDYLLMAALQFVDVPNYSAIIFRRTAPQLFAEDGMIERSKLWLAGTEASYSETRKRWRFPSGATLSFGALQLERDKYDHQGAAYDFIGWDELTHFTQTQYRYLFSRLRRKSASRIPPRVRATSNPGGPGHAWVKERFIDGGEPGALFVPAKLADNPHLDREQYRRMLHKLDPVTRQQLLDGDWDVRPAGGIFKREWFEIVDSWPEDASRRVRFWDLAATVEKDGTDPDWSVGTVCAKARGAYFIGGVDRFRGSPQTVMGRIRSNAQADGRATEIVVEQEPGSSGKMAVSNIISELAGFTVRGKRATGSKLERARPFSSQCEAGNVKLVRGPWLQQWFDELEAFPNVSHDDQVDSASGAFGELCTGWGWGALYGDSGEQADAA